MSSDCLTNTPYRQWEGCGSDAVLLLVHGLGGHTGRWEPLGDFFSRRGISSYAIALRGFGDAPGIKGHIDSFRTYYSDIEALAGFIRSKHPGHKIFLLGESLGGLIVFLSAIRAPVFFSGVICLSPAFKDTLNIGMHAGCKILFSAIFFPSRQFVMPISLSCCSRDNALVSRLEQDPREHRFASARLLMETRISQLAAWFNKSKLTVPVLFLLSGRDTIVSTEASARLFESMKLKDKTIKVYPEMLHALSIDTGREAVFEDIYKWVISHSKGSGKV